ncbi:hypothetical protein PR048_028013 [Dryococelus australis]|uniref:Uncharacterized protein n=1 Tax=Dryococelus australis TaxID=614101 RepID=A0ABQ9GI18_9NEOP|nr:hypothetical protein PR048_028013 [Dryococelus australis]
MQPDPTSHIFSGFEKIVGFGLDEDLTVLFNPAVNKALVWLGEYSRGIRLVRSVWMRLQHSAKRSPLSYRALHLSSIVCLMGEVKLVSVSGDTGEPRKYPSANGEIRHVSHMQKLGDDTLGVVRFPPPLLEEEHCRLARAGDEHLHAKTRLGMVKGVAGIAERRMEGARMCEAELVASSRHQTAFCRVYKTYQRSASRASLQAALHFEQLRHQKLRNTWPHFARSLSVCLWTHAEMKSSKCSLAYRSTPSDSTLSLRRLYHPVSTPTRARVALRKLLELAGDSAAHRPPRVTKPDGTNGSGSNAIGIQVRRGRGVVVGLLAFSLGEPGSISVRVAPLFSHVGIVPDDVAGWRAISGISRFPCPCIPALLHTHLASPSSALKTLMLRATQTSVSLHLHLQCRLALELSKACIFSLYLGKLSNEPKIAVLIHDRGGKFSDVKNFLPEFRAACCVIVQTPCYSRQQPSATQFPVDLALASPSSPIGGRYLLKGPVHRSAVHSKFTYRCHLSRSSSVVMGKTESCPGCFVTFGKSKSVVSGGREAGVDVSQMEISPFQVLPVLWSDAAGRGGGLWTFFRYPCPHRLVSLKGKDANGKEGLIPDHSVPREGLTVVEGTPPVRTASILEDLGLDESFTSTPIVLSEQAQESVLLHWQARLDDEL